MADAPSRRRFGPERITFVPVLFFLLGSLPVATSSPYLAWAVLLPIGWGVWVWRARVVAAPVGLAVCNGLGVTRLPWAEVEGLDVPRRGPVKLLRAGARPLPMTALSRRDLPRLLEIGQRAARPSSP